ncbi:ribonuclease III [Candidatus Giovannonibacteria bacterium RIFCSPLOWO2_02_FULL_43_11b]|uniref:Ribonuclease 3 n=1 Tax=Candidatus Giovannonibacteria bacterium RIFCSPHIGHO2_12_FULL_43_15 TaxID=1798341 RepID=A0A1F5WQ58_9BACT|nr:MAG: ribonuclease III [Candidatus Giovannonibacteria bacterium RIFCSPHIGHO2_01_FULL_43_100]OGF66358.1 MAG: ribonuclease III [Candidatus Giovannonibacteria bacterium RIFCSPHIGHO2_02_FULL_43_32]OGF77717.1 MAG: ribonuclease III [Candidatus Giovannonibacteria bacterium RIFCSPHIGHO2_12_FULL_43_15]OGF78058.1 MAG: ribonuclease III [Candidatus Giovannonibacteria bacterium RIFCSPLOWO2_01_FULL_43_60]OGF89323.1 MAG: ribonuclease III [Candidatus Giovannonibacteria bacterium RIFCSPLOWO2_02_FULL_43_11b]O
MKDLEEFEKSIGVKFKNKELLLEAFTHRSYLNENADWNGRQNERLEFLGDAVLELIVTEHLFSNFKDKAEGELTSYRAALVNANMLSEVAQDLGLNDHLLLSRGEAKDLGRARQYILANTFEALVGAIYLDAGYDAADKFIRKNILSKVSDVISKKLFRDPKSLFQERAQEVYGITPKYEVLKEWGPDHNKHFVIGAYIGNDLVAEGEGPSKQEAQANAAEEGLRIKKWM